MEFARPSKHLHQRFWPIAASLGAHLGIGLALVLLSLAGGLGGSGGSQRTRGGGSPQAGSLVTVHLVAPARVSPSNRPLQQPRPAPQDHSVSRPQQRPGASWGRGLGRPADSGAPLLPSRDLLSQRFQARIRAGLAENARALGLKPGTSLRFEVGLRSRGRSLPRPELVLSSGIAGLDDLGLLSLQEASEEEAQNRAQDRAQGIDPSNATDLVDSPPRFRAYRVEVRVTEDGRLRVGM